MTQSFEALRVHIGHSIKCVTYGPSDAPVNTALECETCGEVLLDFDANGEEEQPSDAEYRNEVRERYPGADVDVDADATVSRSSDGAYVAAWVWVPRP